MRIVHISHNDIAGGAARAAYRLHRSLIALGHDSRMLVARKTSDDPSVIGLPWPGSLATRLRRRLRRDLIKRDFRPYQATRPTGLESFSDDRTAYGHELIRALPPCDVVNLHYAAGLLDYASFFARLPRGTPVAWRLPDMQAFTGGCHYDEFCGRYIDACGACPQLGSLAPHDLSQKIWGRKRAAFARLAPGQLHIVALNSWIAAEVRRSSLLRDVPISVIANGLDIATFAPQDKAAARAAFGIPHDARVVLFVAASVTNRRKGFDLLVQALAALRDLPRLFLVTIGRGGAGIDSAIPLLELGAVNDDARLALAYSAADVYVIPSRQDNLPNTVIEAMACGTPTVGFAVGGVPDMVRPGVTGLLAPPEDSAALADQIRALLADAGRCDTMAQHCRRIALAEHDQLRQSMRYVELYTRLLTARTMHAAQGR
ncbi:glycosyltransferase [Chloroflexales bacterium ZM16-3]|nr:glycosyltransferase [Chloroflexales bacterium ZM16-3]